MKVNMKIILSFDLDFTLIDNREGIVNSFNYAFKKHNLPQMEKHALEQTIGTPLNEIFAKLSSIDPSLLINTFRDFYGKKGIYQAKFLPGAKEKLVELSHLFILGVITSKKEEMAQKLLKIMDVEELFDFILGESKERTSKTDPNLKKYLINQYPHYKFVIIGDHPNDRKLAEMLGCPFIGVLTGNHNMVDLEQNSKIRTLILKSVNEITIDKINTLLGDIQY